MLLACPPCTSSIALSRISYTCKAIPSSEVSLGHAYRGYALLQMCSGIHCLHFPDPACGGQSCGRGKHSRWRCAGILTASLTRTR